MTFSSDIFGYFVGGLAILQFSFVAVHYVCPYARARTLQAAIESLDDEFYAAVESGLPVGDVQRLHDWLSEIKIEAYHLLLQNSCEESIYWKTFRGPLNTISLSWYFWLCKRQARHLQNDIKSARFLSRQAQVCSHIYRFRPTASY